MVETWEEIKVEANSEDDVSPVEAAALVTVEGRILQLLGTVEREGMSELIEWLKKTDFFRAPATTKYCRSYEGGLAEYALEVNDKFNDLCNMYMQDVPRDTRLILGLLHCVCKVGMYTTEMRNKKVNGQWVQVPFYTIKDKMPIGRGEKSVMLLQRFIKLNLAEILAINWYMGSSDYRCSHSIGALQCQDAFSKYPIAMYLNMASTMAMYVTPNVTIDWDKPVHRA